MGSFSISSLGDSAILINFGNIIDEDISKKVLSLFYKLNSLSIPSVKDIVPAYSSLAICYDAVEIKQKDTTSKTAFEIFSEQVKNILVKSIDFELPSSRSIKVPVCYSEKFGLDINEITEQKKIPVEEIIKL